MEQLIVRRTPDGYSVDFEHASDAADVHELFGTYILPAGFAPLATPEQVCQAIESKNPGHNVEFEDEMDEIS